MGYHFGRIEKKWQKLWRAKRTHEPDLKRARRPFYNLMMFPYPSAEGLHVGNMYAYTGADVYGRMKRMQGFDVFEPIGLDGFGIHSENYAIKAGAHPMKLAKKTEENFYRQLQMTGNAFAWREKIETWKPEYYRWTQWVFLELFKRGLVYRKKSPVNWCTSCLTVLADEQAASGVCERCGSEVVKRELEQWFFKITAYAERLLQNLDRLDWSERVKIAQRNWIGRSEGSRIPFTVQGGANVYDLDVFTTRPDTLFGASYVVLSPEHGLIAQAKADIQNFREVQEYLEEAKTKKEEERTRADREKSGVELKGLAAVHPANQSRLPVWVADYVLPSVGTGAIMGVPAHDERDFAFAKQFRLPVVSVIQSVKPKECLLIHDIAGTGNEHWFPWLKAELEKAGWRVASPNLPASEHPRLEDWMQSLAGYAKELNEQSVVVGHGLGAIAALQLLAQSEKRVFKAILVAPFSPGYDWRKRKGQGPELDWDAAQRFLRDADIDWNTAKRRASEIAVYVSSNDPVVPEESIRFLEDRLGASAVRRIPDRYHFDEYHGITDFPELLREFEAIYTGEGILFNSGEWSGMTSREARSAITEFVGGKVEVQYRLRDWLISRQRYWGPPIPLIFCAACKKNASRGVAPAAHLTAGEILNPGWVPVPEKKLPVRLPFIKEFRPTGKGVSPLASQPRFVKAQCPRCGEWAERETDVSDTFLDSAWYFFRYLDPANAKRPFDKALAKKWLPVNMYIGGAEHSVLHLLYARFLTMAFSDFGLVDFEEPFAKFRVHGLLIREGAKISKSKGNVVNPDRYVAEFGADAFRTYLMFLAPFEEGGNFQDRGIVGIERFLRRVHAFFGGRARVKAKRSPTKGARGIEADPELERLLHQTVRKVTEDIEALRLNTAVSALMVLLRAFEGKTSVSERHRETFLKLLAPFAPHLAQELWAERHPKQFIDRERWPVWDPRLAEEEDVALVVQVDGVFRDTVRVRKGTAEADVKERALQSERVTRALKGARVVRVVFIANRVINFCTR